MNIKITILQLAKPPNFLYISLSIQKYNKKKIENSYHVQLINVFELDFKYFKN